MKKKFLLALLFSAVSSWAPLTAQASDDHSSRTHKPSSADHKPVDNQATEQWDGHHYTRNAILQYEWAQKFFFDRHSLKSDARVLDVGSGNGINTAKIAALAPGGLVIGIDNSTSMVTTAKQSFSHLKNLSFYVKDAADLSFYAKYLNFFDVAVSLVTLHWVKDQHAALKGIFTSLKPNGTAYLRLCSKGGDPVQVIADQLSQSEHWRPQFTTFTDPMNRFSAEEYEKILHSEGFSVVRLDDVEDRDQLENTMSLKQQLKSWLPHYHHLARRKLSLAESFLAEVVTEYLKQYPPQDDGSITLIDHYLEVIAQKPAPDEADETQGSATLEYGLEDDEISE